MEKTYFVSGIDTGVGKTVATGLMLRYLASRGISSVSVKMVQTGCPDGTPEDILEHRRLSGTGPLPEDEAGWTSPQIFAYPSSPLLAARLESRQVDAGRISDCVAKCSAVRDVTLVEGAGGLLVPLREDATAADFVAERGWPLILVVSARLGAINHMLLSAEAAASRGIKLAGIVRNAIPETDPPLAEDALRAARRVLAKAGRPDALAEVPRFDSAGEIPTPDFSGIFA